MTEQMAIENIKAFRDSEEIYEYVYADEFIESFDMAIKALEEIKQYRALGTVEELRVARDKQVAKKLKHDVCPNCDTNNDMIIKHLGNPQAHKVVYCWNCGQKLDWSDEDDNC